MTLTRTKEKLKRAVSTERGFSLVETLVAITILLIAVLAPMRIVSQSIKAATFSQEQLTAVFLAQEGIEEIIRLRDDNALEYQNDPGSVGAWDWFDALPEACTDGTGCSYDASAEDLTECTGESCRIYLDETGENGYFYSHDNTGQITPFTRKVTVTDIVSGEELQITSVVSWDSTSFNTNVNVILHTSIFDQYE